jgi:hypothetical protein
MDEITKLMLQDPSFIEAMKDFEARGFIKVKKEGVLIINREGLMEYMKDFGKAPDHFPKVEEDE